MRKSLVVLALFSASVFAAQSAKADDACSSVAGNLLAASAHNCGFESGDFTGWSGTVKSDIFSGVDNLDPFSGTYEAYLGPESGDATLFQTLNTVAGTTYTIQFYLDNTSNADAGNPNDFSATFGSTIGFTETNAPASSYAVETFTALATGPTTTLTFTFENVLGDFDLDSVSVVAVPTTSAVPEPGSLMLLGTGVMGFLGVARRRLKR